ncbi:MAG: ABC transporter permease [Halobacteriales archaeon]
MPPGDPTRDADGGLPPDSTPDEDPDSDGDVDSDPTPDLGPADRQNPPAYWSPDDDPAEDDDPDSGPSRFPIVAAARLPGFVVTTILLGAWAGHDLVVNDGYTVGTWLAEPIDWLFLLSVNVFLFLAVVPLLANPGRTRQYWRRFRRQPWAVPAFAYLVGFVALGLLGPILMDPLHLSFTEAYQPPVFASIDAEMITDCVGSTGGGTCHGSWTYPLGTDRNGYSILRLLGSTAHVSVYVAAITALLIVPIAVTVGTVAGYYGGLVETALMRYVEIQDTVPAIVVYLLVIFLWGESLLLIIVFFGFFGWGGVARRIHSDARTVRNEPYVTAGRSLGGSDRYVLRHHVLPNVSNTVVVATFQQIPAFLLAEAGIAFLGFESFDLQSFGNVIARGIEQEAITGAPGFLAKWWVATIPALALALAVLSFKIVGDGLRDALDPRTL